MDVMEMHLKRVFFLGCWVYFCAEGSVADQVQCPEGLYAGMQKAYNGTSVSLSNNADLGWWGGGLPLRRLSAALLLYNIIVL